MRRGLKPRLLLHSVCLSSLSSPLNRPPPSLSLSPRANEPEGGEESAFDERHTQTPPAPAPARLPAHSLSSYSLPFREDEGPVRGPSSPCLQTTQTFPRFAVNIGHFSWGSHRSRGGECSVLTDTPRSWGTLVPTRVESQFMGPLPGMGNSHGLWATSDR